MNNLQWHVHVSVGLDKIKTTIHVTLTTQVYTLDRPYRQKQKKDKKQQLEKNMQIINNNYYIIKTSF